MASTHKDPVLVVMELTGANDYLNTIVPYSDPCIGIIGPEFISLKTKYCPSMASWHSGLISSR